MLYMAIKVLLATAASSHCLLSFLALVAQPVGIWHTTAQSNFPIERASKIGHIKIIQEPHIQRWINAFEKIDTDGGTTLGELSGKLDLSQVGMLENIVAIDGSHAAAS